MSNEEQKNDRPESEGSAGNGGSERSGKDAASNYFNHLLNLFKRPDDFFTDAYHGLKNFGLIHMGALVVLIAASSFFGRVTTRGFEFGYLLTGIKFGLSFAIPLAALIFFFHWFANRQEQSLSLDFLIEKLGAALVLPAVMVLLSIPLNLLDITLHGWFRAMGLNLIYIAVFMTAYWYVAPKQLAVASLSAIGFYFAYRLIHLIM